MSTPSQSPEDLSTLVAQVIAQAGVGEDIDVMASRGRSTSVRVYKGDVESFTSAGSDGIGIRVITDHRQGFASAGSLSPDVVIQTLADARDNAEFGQRDPHCGLAEPDGVAAVVHDHWDDALVAMAADDKIELAIELERRVVAGHADITGVRTAAWGDHAGEVAYAATNGLKAYERGASCSIGVQALAERDGETQIGAAGDAARTTEGLDIDRVVTDTVDRSIRLLGATKPESGRLPIFLEPRSALTLLDIVSDMLEGEAVSKGRTPFVDRLGDVIASPLLTLIDDPTNSHSIAASSWDGEGLACRRNPLIAAGKLDRFLHNSVTARRCGTTSTGSAVRSVRGLPGVGAQVIVMEPGALSDEQMRRKMGDGIFIASFSGLHSGVNSVSGDFSVGADGIMIRGGEFAEPVREMTVASTLQKMLTGISAVGSESEWTSSGDQGSSLVIDDISISGI